MVGVPRELVRDEVMRTLVTRYRPFPSVPQGIYAALLRAVIAQQISNQSARTILERLRTRIGVSPDEILRASIEDLRACGLSPRKAACIRRIAQMESTGEFRIPAYGCSAQLPQMLCNIPGVGPWTAEMVLVFGLHCPDIWPLSDHGLITAARSAYGVDSRQELIHLGERFRPYRTHAAWYLWRSLEN
jgi:DNA-3-methyladenine glycosylase II